jgi:transcriptional regulator with XRE-family HTH domain
MLNKEIGASITTARRAAKLRQKDLAKIAGIHPVTLSNLENGNIPESLARLLRVFDALGLTLVVRPTSPIRRTLDDIAQELQSGADETVTSRRRVRKPK